jgi:DNA repair exonuclease SbcCD ATPase subunit
MPIERSLLALGVALLLAACQTPPPVPEPTPPTPVPVCPEPPEPPADTGELKALLGHAEELRKALALAQGRGNADLAQATAQLDALAATNDPQAEPLKPLAALMSARQAEQRRLQDSLDRLGQQLRDSQRRNEQLNEKLEALKAIEQTLPAKPVAPR